MSDSTLTTATAERKAHRLAGKYLTFRLGNEEYGLAILKVREIIGLMEVTPVPRTPEHIRGVINLRGKIIPVVSLRAKFGLPSVKDTELTCIIVLDVPIGQGQIIQMGILVDSVSEVLNIDGDHLEETPRFGAEVDTSFILGVGKVAQKVVMLLDADSVLTGQELKAIQQAAVDGSGDSAQAA